LALSALHETSRRQLDAVENAALAREQSLVHERGLVRSALTDSLAKSRDREREFLAITAATLKTRTAVLSESGLQPGQHLLKPGTAKAALEQGDDMKIVSAMEPAKTLAALFEHHGEAFVHCAYLTLLGRAPDAGGLEFYTARARRGERQQVVCELTASPEAGKRAHLIPPDIMAMVRRQRRWELPIIGRLWRSAHFLANGPTLNQRLDAAENLHAEATQRNANSIRELRADISAHREVLARCERLLTEEAKARHEAMDSLERSIALMPSAAPANGVTNTPMLADVPGNRINTDLVMQVVRRRADALRKSKGSGEVPARVRNERIHQAISSVRRLLNQS
jgi:hypothetical protein